MNPALACDVPTPSTPGNASSRASLIIRRVHMYLGLFLVPWMVMYALSTLAMAHRPFVASFYPTKNPKLTLERELDYSRTFTAGATAQERARQILQDLGLEGRHSVSRVKEGEPLVINRLHALFLRRITFDPKTNKLTVQREDFRGLTFLERMHRRAGFQDPYVVENTWAFTADLAVATLVFWALSGVWLWWELRPTRLWGGLCIVLGIVLFATFLALI